MSKTNKTELRATVEPLVEKYTTRLYSWFRTNKRLEEGHYTALTTNLKTDLVKYFTSSQGRKVRDGYEVAKVLETGGRYVDDRLVMVLGKLAREVNGESE